jgi:hypothetical protein
MEMHAAEISISPAIKRGILKYQNQIHSEVNILKQKFQFTYIMVRMQLLSLV